MRNVELECAKCPVDKYGRACDNPEGRGPGGCPTRRGQGSVDAALAILGNPETLEFARAASVQEGEGYAREDAGLRTVKTRFEEICEFAGKMGFTHLGLAFCSGLIREAEILERMLEGRGFRVSSVVCKVGCVPKERIGIEDGQKIRPGGFEAMCNPLAQAEFLNRAGTELNLVMGLCVGHDSLFLKHARAYNTIFAVKDRVLGHNPMTALYLSGSYYKRLAQGASPAEDG